MKTTFAKSPAKFNTKLVEKEFISEMKGRESPPPGTYETNTFLFDSLKHTAKTLPRDERVCPIVPKMQLKIPNISA